MEYTTSATKLHVLRLHPGMDLKQELQSYCKNSALAAATVVSCVGSLAKINLRLADAQKFLCRQQPYEIVSLVGTLSSVGCHLHISLADEVGSVCGGHLLDGCLIYTTAELVILELCGMEFRREFDAATGYAELLLNL